MVLSTEVAFYHKMGTISDNKVVFKYFMASTTPHFYFTVYVVPRENSMDIFYIPKVDNLDNFYIVPLFDSSYGAILGVEYGEASTILLSNEKILGMAEIVEVEISIPDKPVIINDSDSYGQDMEAARALAKDTADTLSIARLYTLANQVMIMVEAKTSVLVDTTDGVAIEGAAYSIIQQILLDKSTLHKALPIEMPDDQKDILYRLFGTLVNLSPYSTDMTQMFTDVILFARAINDKGILIEDIPYKVFYRLAYSILSTSSTDSMTDLETASAAIVKSTTIDLNMATMEEIDKVYALLNVTQNLVYITDIVFKNMETSDNKTIHLDSADPSILEKKKSDCIESRSIQSEGKQVTLQYGYGSGCDTFIGMLFIDEFGSFGIVKDTKLLDGDDVISRMWVWGENSLETFGSEIDSSNNIEVTFIGV